MSRTRPLFHLKKEKHSRLELYFRIFVKNFFQWPLTASRIPQQRITIRCSLVSHMTIRKERRRLSRPCVATGSTAYLFPFQRTLIALNILTILKNIRYRLFFLTAFQSPTTFTKFFVHLNKAQLICLIGRSVRVIHGLALLNDLEV